MSVPRSPLPAPPQTIYFSGQHVMLPSNWLFWGCFIVLIWLWSPWFLNLVSSFLATTSFWGSSFLRYSQHVGIGVLKCLNISYLNPWLSEYGGYSMARFFSFWLLKTLLSSLLKVNTLLFLVMFMCMSVCASEYRCLLRLEIPLGFELYGVVIYLMWVPATCW